MTPPSAFVEALKRDCPHLRVRWSDRRHAWQIEQQVGRAKALAPVREAEGRDDLIRARDGYAFVMEVAAGDRVPCRGCGFPVKLPHLETREVPCGYCRARGHDRTVVGGYWPLGESLLDYLRASNPFRSTADRDAAERQARHADAANAALLRKEDARADQHREDVLFDALLHTIPKVGYTGPSPSTP